MALTIATGRNLRIVVVGLAVIGLLYAAMAVLSLVRGQSREAFISGLVVVVVAGMGLMAWLKSAGRSIPGWLRAAAFLAALFLFWVLFR